MTQKVCTFYIFLDNCLEKVVGLGT